MKHDFILQLQMLLLLLFFSGGGVCYAQNTKQTTASRKGTAMSSKEIAVGGVVRDKAAGKTIPFATVVVRDEANLLIDNVPTDNSGLFESVFQRGEHKAFTVEIAMLGYKHIVRKIEMQSGKRYYNLGIISLEPDAALDAVTVTAPALIMPTAEGYVYDVSADSTAKNKRVVNLLAKLPFIELNEKNVPVYFGESKNIIYLVNGKRDYSMNSSSDVMKMISGKKIKSIELIPNPPVTFSNSDVVISIITIDRRKLFEGFLAELDYSISADKFNWVSGESASIIASAKKFSYSFDVLHAYENHFKDEKSRTIKEQLNDDGTSSVILESLSSSHPYTNSPNFSAGINYDIDKKRQVSAGFHFNNGFSKSYSSTEYEYQAGDDGKTLYLSSSKAKDLSANIKYSNGKFRGKEFKLTYIFSYSDDKAPSKTASGSDSFASGAYGGGYSTGAASSAVSYSRRNNNARSNSSLFSSMFNVPVTDKQAVTFNANYSYNYNRNRNAAYKFDETDNMWKDISGYPSVLRNSVNDATIGASYSFKVKKRITISLSGDFNYYNNNGTLETGVEGDAGFKSSDASYHSFHFKPYASVRYTSPRGHSFSFYYRRSNSHPSVSQLSPAVDESDPFNVLSGNPDLKDSKSDNFSLSYMGKIRKTTYSVIANYVYTADAINYFSTLDEDGVTRSRYENIGVSNSLTLKANVKFSLVRKLELSLSAFFIHNMYRTDTTRRTNSLSGTASCKYMISKRLSCRADFRFTPVSSGYSSIQQTKVYYRTSSNFSISGSSKNMRFTYTLGVNDFTDFRKYDRSVSEYRRSSSGASAVSGASGTSGASRVSGASVPSAGTSATSAGTYGTSSSSGNWYRSTVRKDVTGPQLYISIGYTFGHAKGENL